MNTMEFRMIRQFTTQDVVDHFLEESSDCGNGPFDRRRLGNLNIRDYIALYMCQRKIQPVKVGEIKDPKVEAVLKKIKATNDIVELQIETHEDARHLECYNNCRRYCALNKDYTCCTGWLLFANEGRAQAEHHCVVRNIKTGELKEISVHPGCSTVSFVVDDRIRGVDLQTYCETVSPGAIAIVACEGKKARDETGGAMVAYWKFLAHKQKRLMATCVLVSIVFGLK